MNALRRNTVALSITVALLVSACGGGGGKPWFPAPGNPGNPNPNPGNPGPTAPAAPTHLVASAGVGSVTLSWDAVTGASTYNVYQGLSAGGENSAPVQSNVSGLTTTLTGLTPGVTYYFVVRAVNSAGTSPASNEASAVPQAQAPSATLEVSSLELAQTHVLPAAGLSWTLSDASESYHSIGGRAALAVLRLSATDASNIRLEGWAKNASLGTVGVAAPSALPPTESDGPAYASNAYSAEIPAAWMVPNLQLRALADNYQPGAWTAVSVGADSQAILRVLPFYLYGATPDNSFPLSVTGVPTQDTIDEIYAKWPVASLTAQNHPARAAIWPTMVIPPRGGNAAYLARTKDDQLDGFDTMGAVLGVLGRIMDANGERPAPVQYYGPLIMFNAAGSYEDPGGGLGGGEAGTGDADYRGIFIHEQGHAMGLPHQGTAYGQGKYPYVGGSLAGSVWGYDQTGKRFLGPFVPTSASRYDSCRGDTFDGTPRQIDDQNRCVKQDPMQSGSGDQAAGYRFATFSDYSTGMYQRYFEGVTTLKTDGTHEYSAGSVIADATYPGGYRRWDTIDRRWVNVEAVTVSGGLYGLDGGLPLQRDVPVHGIVLTFSYAGTPQVSQFYPVLTFTGNLMRYIDPSDPAQRASIVPDTSPDYWWYCRAGGCDYTVRVTYADGSQRHVLIQGGFRPWNQARGTPEASASDPLNGDSFRTWAINVPATQAIRKLELLSTPMVWEGMPASPTVLASRDFPTPLLPENKQLPQCAELPTVTAPLRAAPTSGCGALQLKPISAEAYAGQQKMRTLLKKALGR